MFVMAWTYIEDHKTTFSVSQTCVFKGWKKCDCINIYINKNLVIVYMSLVSKLYTNSELNLCINCHFSQQRNIWFQAKKTAKLLGYIDTDQVIRKNVDYEDVKTYPVSQMGQVRCTKLINESPFLFTYFCFKIGNS